MTALLFAALRGHPGKRSAALLDAGASLKTRNRHGMTALLLAAEYNPDPRVTARCCKGLRRPERERAWTAHAPDGRRGAWHNVPTWSRLLQWPPGGADPKAVDHENRTAAGYAQYGNPKLSGTPVFWKLYQGQY